jgi:hypothetical protein
VLTGDVQYIQALRGGPANKGAWSSTTYYEKDDFVTYAGSSWLCTATAPIVNSVPNDTNADWLCIARKGDAGGTGGQATAYSAAGWLNQSWAPSAGVLRNIIETLAKLTDIASLAPIASPSFTGNPSRSTAPTNADRSASLATTAWVGTNFATLDSPVLLNNPSAPTQAISDVSGKLATTKFVDDYARGRSWGVLVYAQQTIAYAIPSGSYAIVPFPTELIDSSNLFTVTGYFTPTVTGFYSVSCNLFFSVSSGSVGLYAAAIYQANTNISILFLDNATGVTVCNGGQAVVQMTAGLPYHIRAFSSAAAPSIGVPAGALNTLTIERVSLI